MGGIRKPSLSTYLLVLEEILVEYRQAKRELAVRFLPIFVEFFETHTLFAVE